MTKRAPSRRKLALQAPGATFPSAAATAPIPCSIPLPQVPTALLLRKAAIWAPMGIAEEMIRGTASVPRKHPCGIGVAMQFVGSSSVMLNGGSEAYLETESPV